MLGRQPLDVQGAPPGARDKMNPDTTCSAAVKNIGEMGLCNKIRPPPPLAAGTGCARLSVLGGSVEAGSTALQQDCARPLSACLGGSGRRAQACGSAENGSGSRRAKFARCSSTCTRASMRRPPPAKRAPSKEG